MMMVVGKNSVTVG